jgi:hypothetical protein
MTAETRCSKARSLIVGESGRNRRPSASQADFQEPWWEEKAKTKALPKLQRLFRFYADRDRGRLSAYTGYERLYTNRDLLGSDYLQNYSAAFKPLNEFSRVPINVAKVMTDAVHARLTRPAIAVEFLPAGGNNTLRRRSRQASQFVAHQFHKSSIRHQESLATLDALVCGFGAIKTCPHPKLAEIENFRVHPRHIFCDPIEASVNGKPTHLYQRQFVSRGKLKKLFPKNAATIAKAGRISQRTSSDWSDQDTLPAANLVEVVEAWKLPSWRGAGDGKHALFINGACLEFSEWTEPDFPFTFTRWKDDPTVGFFGISLVEELIGIHSDINTSVLHTEKCIEATPKPYILVPADGEVTEGQLAGVEGVIINFTGRPPQIVMPPSVPQDIVNYISVQWQRALQVARLVAMGMPESAGGQAETGAAFDTIIDIQSTELAPAFKNREDFLIRLAEQQINAGRHVDKREKGGFKTVLRKDRNTVEAVEWKLFALDPKEDSYVVQAQPASALSATFGQRLAQVKELLGIGLIPMSRAFKLLDIPDLDSEMRIQNASLDFIERIMEEILDDGEYTAPEPTMDLRLALKVSQKYINFAQALDVSDDRVAMLDDFLRSVSELIKEEQDATRAMAEGIANPIAGAPPATDINGAAPAAAAQPGF